MPAGASFLNMLNSCGRKTKRRGFLLPLPYPFSTFCSYTQLHITPLADSAFIVIQHLGVKHKKTSRNTRQCPQAGRRPPCHPDFYSCQVLRTVKVKDKSYFVVVRQWWEILLRKSVRLHLLHITISIFYCLLWILSFWTEPSRATVIFLVFSPIFLLLPDLITMRHPEKTSVESVFPADSLLPSQSAGKK